MAGTLTKPSPVGLTPRVRRRPLGTFRELEDLFEQFWNEDGNGWGTQMLAPPIDVIETDEALQVSLDLPGVEAKEIDIQVNGNQLTISGERNEEKEEKGATFHRIERRAGQFSRTVMLPCCVDENKIDATYHDGVLSIALPKAEEAKARRIKVKPR